MPSEINVSGKNKTLSWEDRDTYVVIDLGGVNYNSHNPFKIIILNTDKGKWIKKPHDINGNNWSEVIQIQDGAGSEKNVLVSNSSGYRVVVFNEQANPKTRSINGQIPSNSCAFGFNVIFQSPRINFSASSRDYDLKNLAHASGYRDVIIRGYEKNYLEKFADGKQYKITSEDETFYYEESKDTRFVDEIADKLKKVCASDVKEELETWLSDDNLWESPYLANEPLTLDDIMSKLPEYNDKELTEEELSKGGLTSKLYIDSIYGTTDETKFNLKSGSFNFNHRISSESKLHWDEEQEKWAVKISARADLTQNYDVSFIDKNHKRRQLTKTVTISWKENTRLLPLSFDDRDGKRPMLKELASLGEFSKVSATDPDGKKANGIAYERCFAFKLEDLGTQPKWLQDIVSLAPKAFQIRGNSTTKMKPLSRGEPSTTSSPRPVQHPRSLAPQNHMGPNSELNWHIVEALQRIAEAMERIADKNND